MNERVKFRGCFTLQANTTVRPRGRMHEALMKSIGWCELAPESHRITNITSGNIGTGFGRHYAIPLNAETIGPGALIFLFPVNGEISSRGRFGGKANTARHCHQATITFHDINVLFRKRDFYCNLRRVIWFVSRHVIRAAAGYR